MFRIMIVNNLFDIVFASVFYLLLLGLFVFCVIEFIKKKDKSKGDWLFFLLALSFVAFFFWAIIRDVVMNGLSH